MTNQLLCSLCGVVIAPHAHEGAQTLPWPPPQLPRPARSGREIQRLQDEAEAKADAGWNAANAVEGGIPALILLAYETDGKVH